MDDQLLELFQEIHDTAKDKGSVVNNAKEAIFKILKSKHGRYTAYIWINCNFILYIHKDDWYVLLNDCIKLIFWKHASLVVNPEQLIKTGF